MPTVKEDNLILENMIASENWSMDTYDRVFY